jgi:hypothetical protein
MRMGEVDGRSRVRSLMHPAIMHECTHGSVDGGLNHWPPLSLLPFPGRDPPLYRAAACRMASQAAALCLSVLCLLLLTGEYVDGQTTKVKNASKPVPARPPPRQLLKRREVGGPCEDSDDCAADLICSLRQSKCVRAAKEGEICESDQHCGTNLKCGADSTCTSITGDVGSRCADTADCADELVCHRNKMCARSCKSAKGDCLPQQTCDDGICISLNYGPCLPKCADGLQCNVLTNKCRPKTVQMEKCDDEAKVECVKQCLKVEPTNADRIVYCGHCCMNQCRCLNGPGWFKMVTKSFLDLAIGPYGTYNMSVSN